MILHVPFVFMSSQIYKIFRNLKRKRHKSVSCWCWSQTIWKTWKLLKKLPLKLLFFCTFKPSKPFNLFSSTTNMLKVLIQLKLLYWDTILNVKVARWDENRSIFDVVLIFFPPHWIVLSMSSRMVHVMDNVHIWFEYIAVYNTSSASQIVETSRE
jgi:hypothetical protein